MDNKRRMVFWSLAAFYLVAMMYKLAKGLPDLNNNSKIISIIAIICFGIFTGYLVISIIGMAREEIDIDRKKREEDENEDK